MKFDFHHLETFHPESPISSWVSSGRSLASLKEKKVRENIPWPDGGSPAQEYETLTTVQSALRDILPR